MTAAARDVVSANARSDSPLTAPSQTAKCAATTYQIAGNPNYTGGPGDAQPTAGRFRIFTLPDDSGCKTGDVWVAGAPSIGGTTCFNGSVVAVAGVANGDVTP